MRKRLIILVILTLCMLVVGCINTTREVEQVRGTVVEREYERSKTEKKKVTNSNGKVTYKKRYKPEEYEVDIAYANLEVEVDSKNLYNSVREGETILVDLVKVYNKKGKLISEYIEYNGDI